MNLAIEYQIRNKKSHKLIVLPCSLFVTNSDDKKIVITIYNSYGQNNLTVKHWKTWLANPAEKLPPFDEFKVEKENMFSSPHIIVENYSLMEYAEDPYPSGVKQHSDPPESEMQENEYAKYLHNYLYTTRHREKRVNWLWEVFESIYVTSDLKFKYGLGEYASMQIQRDLVQFYSKKLWYTWQYWRKHMLDFPGCAAELIFKPDYVRKTKSSSFLPFFLYTT